MVIENGDGTPRTRGAGATQTVQLSRLKKIDPRSAWVSEAAEFTPWLAQDENLALLGETIGINLELEAQERNVGPFRADILCKDTATNHWVLIENQLERTDHAHLGQLLTYAAGLDAVTIVWIADHFTDEHRAALDWLNLKTESSVNFFGLEIELWQIGDSLPAPKFNIVCKPNDWSTSVTGTAREIERSALTPIKQLQLEYWEAFREELLQHSFLRTQKPQPFYAAYLSIGRSGVNLIASLSWRASWIQASVIFTDAKREAAWFPALLADRDAIDRELGVALPWDQSPDGYKESRMAIRLDASYRDREDWPRQHAWLREQLEALHRVFAPRLKALRLDSSETAVMPL